MNKNVEELRTILKEYNLNEPAYKGLIDIEVLKGVLDEVDRLNNIINKALVLTQKIIDAGWDYNEIGFIAIDLEKLLKGEEK